MKKVILLFMALFLFPSVGFAVTLPASHYAKGLLQPRNWEEKAEYLTLLKSEPLPSHFDWREKLGTQATMKDQANCGSCWAFSRTSTLEWQLLIQTGQHVVFSPQELVSCDKEQLGCSGGFWDDYEVKGGQGGGGISLESEFGYKASDVQCKSSLPRKQKIDKWLYIGGKNRSPTKDEMKQAILQYGPIGVTVAAGGSFPTGCGGGQTNHMTVNVGWDDAKGGWIMQNSWGSGWADGGYAIIKYGCFSIGETAAVSVLNVEPEKPVTFDMENASVSLTITVQPQSGYGANSAKTAIQKTLNAVGN